VFAGDTPMENGTLRTFAGYWDILAAFTRKV
jgi:hypothetical protein